MDSIIVLFIFLAIGYVIRKINVVDENFNKNLSNFLFSIIIPAAIIKSMIMPFSIEVLKECFHLLILAVIVIASVFVISKIISSSLTKDKTDRKVLEFDLLFPNFDLMAYPIIAALYGDKGIFYVSIFIIPYRLFFNTYGLSMMQNKVADKKINIKELINAPLIGVIVGLAIFLFSIRIPPPIEMTINMLSPLLSPLGMMVGGLVLTQNEIKGVFKDKKVYYASIARLIIVPFIVLFILYLFNIQPLYIILIAIIMMMPVPAVSIFLAERFDGNSYLAAQLLFVSTILSIISIPACFWVLNILLKV